VSSGRPPEPPIASRPIVLLVAAAVAWGVVAVGLALTSVEGIRIWVVAADESWRASAVDSEVPPLVWLAELLAILGSVWVTSPLRLVVALVFVARRWWWRFGAWVGSIVLMEVVVTAMKDGYARPRPPLALEVTRSEAFPSGHSAAAAVTAAALVLLLVPPDGLRRRWTWVAVLVVGLMAASRVYLRVHWVSDVLMGAAIGLAAALLAVGLAAWAQARRSDRAERSRDV
jgi:membrane-associated phospholipid phosphatase